MIIPRNKKRKTSTIYKAQKGLVGKTCPVKKENAGASTKHKVTGVGARVKFGFQMFFDMMEWGSWTMVEAVRWPLGDLIFHVA